MQNERCSICQENRHDLVRIDADAQDNVKYCVKLIDCVPEINWDQHHLICPQCRQKIDIVYDFKRLCLKSLLFHENSDNYTSDNDVGHASDAGTGNKPPLGGENFVCYHCEGTFLRKADLIEHIRSEHNLNSCKICKASFDTQMLLQSHLVGEHSIGEVKTKKLKRYKCPKCLKLYTTEKVMNIHYLRCNASDKQPDNNNTVDKPANVCVICKSTFLTKYLLKRHIKNVHATEKLFDCEICGQKFASHVYLTAHKRYHVGDRSHICSFCGKGFITKSDLYHHEKIHANKRDYKCQLCPKAFNTSSDLHKHKICVHSDRTDWKYVCRFCDKRFPLKTNLDSHTKTHTGERNFACHLCDRKCINRSVLQRHIESHSNVRSFRCDACGQEYKYRKSLDVHLAKAHGIGDTKVPERVKKYFCHICPKAYYANNKLQKHIRSHTGERPFQCPTCGKRFIDKSYVKQHMRLAHNISVENNLFPV